jgi:hypothetical protein
MVRFTVTRRVAPAVRSQVTFELSANALELPARDIDAPAQLGILR